MWADVFLQLQLVHDTTPHQAWKAPILKARRRFRYRTMAFNLEMSVDSCREFGKLRLLLPMELRSQLMKSLDGSGSAETFLNQIDFLFVDRWAELRIKVAGHRHSGPGPNSCAMGSGQHPRVLYS
jgi:hypothetical protein